MIYTYKDLKNYYSFKRGRLSQNDIDFIARQFVKNGFSDDDILSFLLMSGIDILSLSKVLNRVGLLRSDNER